MENLQAYYNQGVDLLLRVVPQFLWAIVALLVGLWIIKLILKATNKAMEKGNVDASLRKFLNSLIGIGLKVLLLISVASMLGIATTSFIAVIGAAGLAVGLALQGSLANFAGGVLILLFKPFKVGDVIESQGHTGKVAEIQVFNTILKTPDNKTIIVPNGAVSNGSIVNYSTEAERRVDMTFGIGYEDDIQKAKDILLDLLEEDNRILKNPVPQVLLSELADSSVNFAVRAWVKGSDYWDVYFDMQEKVKKAFDANNISIPYPQHDVHLFNEK
jgi:small conductance mechanosensitive channel